MDLMRQNGAELNIRWVVACNSTLDEILFRSLVFCASYECIADLLNSRHIFFHYPAPNFTNFELKFQHRVRTTHGTFFKCVLFCFSIIGDFANLIEKWRHLDEKNKK